MHTALVMVEWLEGRASDSGPFIMGAELTLVCFGVGGDSKDRCRMT
jgi:hypothetical protein